MSYPKLLSPTDILDVALYLVEHGDAPDLSLRAVASALGVQAPSLYRYFPNKQALQIAVAEQIWTLLLGELQPTATIAAPEVRFHKTVDAYLHFARKRFPLYSFVLENRYPELYWSKTGKAVWNLLLAAASGVSGRPDDTAAAVATWSFLHGYATLEHSGAFGTSGPKGGLERGVQAFLGHLQTHTHPAQETRSPARARKPAHKPAKANERIGHAPGPN